MKFSKPWISTVAGELGDLHGIRGVLCVRLRFQHHSFGTEKSVNSSNFEQLMTSLYPSQSFLTCVKTPEPFCTIFSNTILRGTSNFLKFYRLTVRVLEFPLSLSECQVVTKPCNKIDAILYSNNVHF